MVRGTALDFVSMSDRTPNAIEEPQVPELVACVEISLDIVDEGPIEPLAAIVFKTWATGLFAPCSFRKNPSTPVDFLFLVLYRESAPSSILFTSTGICAGTKSMHSKVIALVEVGFVTITNCSAKLFMMVR